MSITTISPRMQKALDDGKQLQFFADLWLSVLNRTVDTQAEFEASVLSSQMDFTTQAGSARLAEQVGAFNISQATQDTQLTLNNQKITPNALFFGVQYFTLDVGRRLSELTVYVAATADETLTVNVYKGEMPKYTMYDNSPAFFYAVQPGEDLATWFRANLVQSLSCPVASGYTGEKVFTLDVALPEGVNTIMVSGTSGLKVNYKASDVYSGGSFSSFTSIGSTKVPYKTATWTNNLGDLYFKLKLSGYYASGYFVTDTLDLGEVPVNNGTFQMAYQNYSDTVLSITLYGSSTGAFAGEETTIPLAADGITIAPFRFWRVRCDLATNASINKSPRIDMLEVLYPKDLLKLRVKGTALRYVSAAILRDYQPLLKQPAFQMSELKIIERVASGGTITMALEDTQIETIQRFVSDSPLKNYRGILYIGADVPGFCEADLLRFFVGVVDAGDIKPKFRTGTYGLTLTLKNPILELTRKVPLPGITGQLDLNVSAINYNGTHVMDAVLDLLRGQAAIPARYVNVTSITAAKETIGGSYLASQAHIVRRSNAFADYTPRVASACVGNGIVANVAKGSLPFLGDYVITCKTEVAVGGVFSVLNPNKTALLDATVGTPFTGTEIQFLISAGTIDFKLNDKFTISVISPDTRLKSPEEIRKHLAALATIADGYFVPNENSQITFVQHDETAAAESIWADEALVRSGEIGSAVPMEGIDSIKLGYDDLLFNCAIMGCEWDGTGSDWTAYSVLANVDAQSADDMAPGSASYLSVMEANLKEASKWLGPEPGYNGATIAEALTSRFVARFGYPPLRLMGVTVNISQFRRTLGSVVQIHSREIARFRRRGIANSETVKFLVMGKTYDPGSNKMKFNLLELT